MVCIGVSLVILFSCVVLKRRQMKYKSERKEYFRDYFGDYFAYWQARLRDANPLLALDAWLLGIP